METPDATEEALDAVGTATLVYWHSIFSHEEAIVEYLRSYPIQGALQRRGQCTMEWDLSSNPDPDSSVRVIITIELQSMPRMKGIAFGAEAAA